MRRPIILTLLSVLAVFLAVTFDLFRIFQASDDPTDPATRSLLVLREVFLAAGIFIRYLFYLEYASRWPDSTTSIDSLAVRWWDWPILRIISEGTLFIIAFIMFILQLVWRLTDNDSVYTANVVLQLCWTTVIMLKMGYSIVVFPEQSLRWRFAKLVLPIMAALLIEWSVSIGNAVMRAYSPRGTVHTGTNGELQETLLTALLAAFSRCAFSRTLKHLQLQPPLTPANQAVEVYIIILALMGISVSRLVAQGPLSTLPSQLGEKSPSRFTRLAISKPILPSGLPKFSFRAAPRPAPQPPADVEGQQESGSRQKWRLSTWLAARLSGERRQAALDRPRILLDPSPIGTPELDQWRVKNIPRKPSIMAPLPPAVVVLAPSVSSEPQQDSAVDLSRDPPRRSYVPPPTPPPMTPLPAPPPRLTPPRVTPVLLPLQLSGSNLPTKWRGSHTSTFGHQSKPSTDSTGNTTADPVLPSRQSYHESDTDASSRKKRDRRSSAPLLSLSLTTPLRATRALSNPPGSGVAQSIEQLLREQDALERAYAPSPDPRRSIASTLDGAMSEESTMLPPARITSQPVTIVSPEQMTAETSGTNGTSPSIPDFAMRNSTRSTFSLSKFPQPPANATTMPPTSFLLPTQPSLTSRFSASSSSSELSAIPPRPPSKDYIRPRLTVDTDLTPQKPRRPSQGSIGLPSNPRALRGQAWDVTSFISGAGISTAIAPSELSSASPVGGPPPSAATPNIMSADGPLSTMSSSPSPRLPRPPPRRNRNMGRSSLAQQIQPGPLSAPIDTRPKSVISTMSDDEPGMTGSATKATRINRVRFIENPRTQPSPPPQQPLPSLPAAASTLRQKSRFSQRIRTSSVWSMTEGDADIEEEEGEAEVRLAGRVVPLGVGTMSVAKFRSASVAGRNSVQGGDSRSSRG